MFLYLAEEEQRERQDEQLRSSLEKLNNDADMVDSDEIAKMTDSGPSQSEKQADLIKNPTTTIINAAKTGLSVLQKTPPEENEPEKDEVLDDNPFAHQLWN